MAFKQENESFLIETLRKTKNFIAELSLVAEVESKIIGHILFYPIVIISDDREHIALALAPMSVHPSYQRQGIGKKLVVEGLKLAKEKGYSLVIVLGHPEYYPKFGFEKAGKFGTKAPFDAPEDAFMVIELKKDALYGVSGVVKYPQPFYDAV